MYNSLRVEKINTRDQMNKTAAHNFRLHSQPNIDASKTHLNQVLLNNLEMDLKQRQGFAKAFLGHYAAKGVKVKQDNVLALEMIITASPEMFDGKTQDQIDLWATEQVQFAQEKFGENCRLAVLHLDEKTPHIHFLISTEHTTTKKYKNRYGATEKITTSLNAKRWNPAFLTKLHDDHAILNKKWGLKRGVKGSKRAHKTLKEYYGELNKLENDLKSGLNQYKKDRELLAKAKHYIEKAKKVMDEQYQEIMTLLDIAVGKDLNPIEQKQVNEIMQKQLSETKKRNLKGGNPP